MPSSDYDEVGTLRSGKRFRVGGKKRNFDGECKRYIEGHFSSDSEDHSNEIKWVKTLEKPKTPEVRTVTSSESGSNTGTVTHRGSIVPPGGSFTTSSKKAMEGGEMRLPLFHGNGSEDP